MAAFPHTHTHTHTHGQVGVDVLTLSATPIPRTLQLAMSGLREMTTILTPPPMRRQIETRVAPDDEHEVPALPV